MADTLVYFIIVLFFIFTVILILAWVFLPQTFKGTTEKPKQQPSTGPAGFLEPCSTVIECDTGLTCDSNICKKDLGGTCETLSDCSSEANSCIGGICLVAGTGDVNEPPPCMEGLTPDDNNICKFILGQTCEINSECLSFVCDDNICKEPLKLGDKCLPEQCGNQLHCSLGFCQSDNIETGETGAFCKGFNIQGDLPRCNTDNLCVFLSGEIDPFPPICKKRTVKKLEVCTNGSKNGPYCLFNMDCVKGEGIFFGKDRCSTKYQYYDCSETSQCSLGYVCEEERCSGQPDTICFTNEECSSKSCQGKFSSIWIDDGIFWTKQFSVPQFFDRIEQNFITGIDASNWGLKLPKTGVPISDTGFYYKKQTAEWKKILNISNPEGDILDFGIAIPNGIEGFAKAFVLVSKSMSTKFAIYTVDIQQDGSGKLSIYTDNIDLPGLIFLDIGPTFLNTVVVSNDKNIWVSDENLFTKQPPVNITFKMLTTTNVTKLAKPRLYASCILDKDTGECIFPEGDINDLNISYINQTDPTRDRMKFNGPLSIIDNYPINDGNFDKNELKIFDYQVQSQVDSEIDDIIVTIAGMTATGNQSESIIFQIQQGIQWTIPGETSDDVSLYQSQTDSLTPNINIVTGVCS